MRWGGWRASTRTTSSAWRDGSDDFDNFEPVEYRVLRPDGTIRWVRASGAALRDRDDTIIGLVGTATDVTELRDADERLRDREERTRAILETAAEGIVSTNERGVILEFNAAAERIFGYDSDDVIEQCSFSELLAHDDQVLLRELHVRVPHRPTHRGGPHGRCAARGAHGPAQGRLDRADRVRGHGPPDPRRAPVHRGDP